MFVVKRNGKTEPVHFDKITSRIKKLSYGLDPLVDPAIIVQRVCRGLVSGMHTYEIDNLAAETAAAMASIHSDHMILASRIAVSNLHKSTPKLFSEVIEEMYRHVHAETKEPAPLINQTTYEIVKRNADQLNSAIITDRDFQFDYFGFKTLERSYLIKKSNKEPLERPQHMYMRVAVGIHGEDIESAIETYELMSRGDYTHASPTLFQAGTTNPQLSSCFLLNVKEDSIDGIYETLKHTAKISKHAGGIGLSVSNIRASRSFIRGTGGHSNGLIPMLRVYNETARYVDQGGGKRKGAFAVYLEPWHADVFKFLDIRKNHGNEFDRCRDLFNALWAPDLFMKRVENNEIWSLFCPNEAPGLADCFGKEFEDLYARYETEKRYREQVPARTLWKALLSSQVETGVPYFCLKDNVNYKSNQSNLGIIRCSNLCTEIMEYTDSNHISVCNLASVALPKFVLEESAKYDFERLYQVTYKVCINLNKVIDVNFYPIEDARKTNIRDRPIGIGVQGLADVYTMLRMPWESAEAADLNVKIFETMYFAALTASKDLAKIHGPYDSYTGSPISQGKFQFDLWQDRDPNLKIHFSGLWDWEGLRKEIALYGVRNSLLMAPMPTASTSQILGNVEGIEPRMNNVYVRGTNAGEFFVVNRFLVKDLIQLGKWNTTMKDRIVAANGSIQSFEDIPQELKNLYKTVWEIKDKSSVSQAADRAPFIDQSQSLNCYLANPTFGQLTSRHFYAWRRGLKTGMYYLRTLGATETTKFSIDKTTLQQQDKKKQKPETTTQEEKLKCSLRNKENCISCSS